MQGSIVDEQTFFRDIQTCVGIQSFLLTTKKMEISFPLPDCMLNNILKTEFKFKICGISCTLF